jgi:acetyl esterase
MPLDPQAKAVIDVMTQMGLSITGDPAAVRATLASFPAPPGEPVDNVVDVTVPSPAGPIPVRVYTPAGAGAGSRPALVWFHGGGWVIGDLNGADFSCRAMANRAGCVVVSVDYRLAPEAKFPAAVDDCYTATKWVAENGASIGVDGSRIAVGGDSAGGNLATVVAQLAKERKGPAIRFQALVYPVTDHNFETVSYRENADGYLLTKDSMVWFWNHYLNSVDDGKSPMASPMRASDLKGLPPAIVITAEFDPLRDEGEAYAARLREAGVNVQVTRYPGQIHAFYGNVAINDGMKALDQVSAALRAALK